MGRIEDVGKVLIESNDILVALEVYKRVFPHPKQDNREAIEYRQGSHTCIFCQLGTCQVEQMSRQAW